jgi:TonB family protein
MLKVIASLIMLWCCTATAKAQPVFKDGAAALDRFISDKLIYPEFSSQNCIAATINVGFSIDKDGKVTNAKVQQGPGIDLDEEALRVVKLTSGKWMIPANYTGSVRVILPIRFNPDYVKCQNRAGQSMNMQQAIVVYQKRQELENAVTNYYINKYTGKADTEKENTIQTLKKELGINEELWTDLLDQANQKLKQGDKEGACKDWNFIKNTGSDMADSFLAKYCN